VDGDDLPARDHRRRKGRDYVVLDACLLGGIARLARMKKTDVLVGDGPMYRNVALPTFTLSFCRRPFVSATFLLPALRAPAEVSRRQAPLGPVSGFP
jgi:hypothetical protein